MTASVPIDLSTSEVKITSEFDHVTDASTAITIPLSETTPTHKRGAVAMPVPSRQSASWVLVASAEDLTQRSEVMSLRPALDINAALIDPVVYGTTEEDLLGWEDWNVPAPERAALEPDGSCREWVVLVHAPDPPPDHTVTLTATGGRFADGDTTTLHLRDGRAWTSLSLDNHSMAVDQVTVQIEATDLDSVGLTATLEPVLPEGGALLPSPAPALAVDAAGSEATTLYGWLQAPEGAALDDVTVDVVTHATADGEATDCSPLNGAALDCDPNGLGPGTHGACGLTTAQAAVDTDATFEAALAPVCFSGDVSISAFVDAYALADSQSCLGLRAVTPNLPLGSETLSFEATPTLTQGALYDTCIDAVVGDDLATLTAGALLEVDTAPFTSVLDGLACNGIATPGPEGHVRVELAAGESLDVTAWAMSQSDDFALMLVPTCTATAACVAHANSADPENLTYTNASATTEQWFLIVDSASTPTGPVLLDVQIE